MLSLALRISQSLFLEKSEPPFPVTPLQREMRSRLWHTICLLDVQASYDRGLAPMLRADCLKSQVIPAMNFLDYFMTLEQEDSLSPESTSLANPLFLMVIAEGQRAFRSLDLSVGTDPSVVGANIHSRLQIAINFQKESQTMLDGFSLTKDPSDSVHLFLEKIAYVTYLYLQLIAVNPVQLDRNSHSFQWLENHNISLSFAVNFLQALKDLHENLHSGIFRWYYRLFVPWHAFSVAMEQVCSCHDPSLQAYYHPLINELYSSLQDLMSDAHQRLLQPSFERFNALPQTCMNLGLSFDDLLTSNVLSLYDIH